MAEIIDLPQQGGGTAQQQLQEMYLYLYRMATDLNLNFQQIGFDGLTDDEQQLMNDLTRAEQTDVQKAEDSLYTGKHNYTEAATLKSLIIKTAQFVKNEVENMRIVLFGEESASGQFGDWKRRKGLRVDVTPDGVKQTYSYAEIVQGLQTFEINAKNYIKTGYLRTENQLPVYGVQVGKDIVTFDENGNETYHDGNKVAEFTADALSFYANGTILAKYTGTKTSFYVAGEEVMYIQAGKIYSAVDMELGAEKYVKINDFKFTKNGLLYNDGQFIIGPPLNSSSGWPLTATLARISGAAAERNAYGLSITCDSDAHDIYFGTREVGVHGEKEVFFVPKYFKNSDSLAYNLGSSGYKWDKIYGKSIYGDVYADYLMPSGSNRYIGSSNNHWYYAYINSINASAVFYDVLQQNSSRIYKEKIRNLESQGDVIDQLRPVRYRYKEKPDVERLGLIYEETIDKLPEICVDSGDRKGINYPELIPVLLKEIQELRARVKALEEKGD